MLCQGNGDLSVSHKSTIVIGLISTLFVTSAISAVSPVWKKSLIIGYGVTSANQTQTVRLSNTPLPGQDNRYLGHSTMHGAALFGLAIDNHVVTSDPRLSRDIGFEIDYLRNNAVSGTVEPMYNVSPNFDELRYAYDIHTLVMQATGKYMLQNVIYDLSVYLQAGIGLAMNRLSDYREYAPSASTASPMLIPFGNQDTVDAAISAGVGFTRDLGQAEITVGYRFFNTGRARLKKSPLQQTNTSIILPSLNFHFLMVSVTI